MYKNSCTSNKNALYWVFSWWYCSYVKCINYILKNLKILKSSDWAFKDVNSEHWRFLTEFWIFKLQHFRYSHGKCYSSHSYNFLGKTFHPLNPAQMPAPSDELSYSCFFLWTPNTFSSISLKILDPSCLPWIVELVLFVLLDKLPEGQDFFLHLWVSYNEDIIEVNLTNKFLLCISCFIFFIGSVTSWN